MIHKYQVSTLSNGIPVVWQENDTGVGTLYWMVRTGSCDEQKGQEGFAHFVEHMLFKDAAAKETGLPSEGELAREIESLGGDVNAYTSLDQTVYHVTSAERHWEKVIRAFLSMARPQKFQKADFFREKEVILEELKKTLDSPDRQLFQSLFSLRFGRHPYGRPVIGKKGVLQKARPSDLQKFYRNHYIPQRMGVVLVGPLGPPHSNRRKKIQSFLEQSLGKRNWPKRKVYSRPMSSIRTSGKPHCQTLHFDVNSPTLSFGFPAPELQSLDLPALDAFVGILAQGDLSRLYQRLFYQLKKATDVSGSVYVPFHPGLTYLAIDAQAVSDLPLLTEATFEEIRRLVLDGPRAEELERIVAQQESERIYATQTVDGMASRLGFLEFVVRDPQFDEHYTEQTRALRLKDIQEVGRRYFNEKNLFSVVMIPKKEKFDPNIILKKAKILQFPEKKQFKKPRLVESEIRPSGMRVAHLARSQSQVFSLHASVLGGVRLEKEKQGGLSQLLSLTLNRGTEDFDAQEVLKQVEGSAASLEGFSGRNSVGLQVTGLTRDWEKLSQIFLSVLTRPVFPENELEHSKRVMEDAIKGLTDHSASYTHRLFLQQLFERHPYQRSIYGDLKTLGELSRQDVVDQFKQWFCLDRLVLSAAGGVSSHQLESLVSQIEAGLSSEKKERDEFPDEPDLVAPRWIEKVLSREQCHFIQGGLGTKVSSKDRAAVVLVQTIVGGQSGRLFTEIREKNSLAYTVSPFHFEGIERGFLGSYCACSPNKRKDAESGIQKVFEKLAEKGPRSNELIRAREYYLGQRAMDLQSDSSQAAHIGLNWLYNQPPTEDSEFLSQLRSVSLKEIKEVVSQYYVDPFFVTATVT